MVKKSPSLHARSGLPTIILTPTGAQYLPRGWWEFPEGADGVEHRHLEEPAVQGGPVQQLLGEQPARVPHRAQLPGQWWPVALGGASSPAAHLPPAHLPLTVHSHHLGFGEAPPQLRGQLRGSRLPKPTFISLLRQGSLPALPGSCLVTAIRQDAPHSLEHRLSWRRPLCCSHTGSLGVAGG